MKKRTRKNVYKKKASSKKLWMGNRARVSLSALAIITMAVFLGLGLIFSYDFLTQLDFFNAKNIQVEGLQRVSRAEVLHLAKIQLGMNVLRVNLPLTRKRLAAHPWIADAAVRREIPSTILIQIREEQPLAVLHLNRKYLINNQGQIFKALADNDVVSLPHITGLDYADLGPEGNPSGQTFRAVMEILRFSLEDKGVLATRKIKRIGADRDIGLQIHLEDGPKSVKLGFGSYSQKIRLLERLQRHLERQTGYRGIRNVDLSNPDRIVLLPLTEATPEASRKEV